MASEPIFLSDGEVDPISHLHLPRIRQVDEGQWRAMPNLNRLAVCVYGGVCLAVAYGLYEGLAAAYRLARSLLP